VFGRAAGLHINEALKSGGGVANADKDDIDKALHNLNVLNESSSGHEVSSVKRELQEVMQNYFGVFRRGDYMEKGVSALEEIREKIENLHLQDKSAAFNTNRVEAIELQNLFEVAEATAISSLQRTESRGAHAREDFPERDDQNWLCHSLYDPTTKILGKRHVNFEPNQVEAFPPKVRTY
jgi:succinate dehydrogenase / fumarate reductase flavoprotein subunit